MGRWRIGCPNGAGENCSCKATDVERREEQAELFNDFKTGLLIYSICGVPCALLTAVGFLVYGIFISPPLVIAPFIWTVFGCLVFIVGGAIQFIYREDELNRADQFRELRCAVRQLRREREEQEERHNNLVEALQARVSELETAAVLHPRAASRRALH